MNKTSDHTVLITVCVLIGVIATVTLAVATNVYNNSRNVERDKYYAGHCSQVTKTIETSVVPNKVTYECR